MADQPWYQGTVVITVSNLNSGELKAMIFSINETEENILSRISKNECNLSIGLGNKSKESFWADVPSPATHVEVAVLYAMDLIGKTWLDEKQMTSKIKSLLCL